MRTQTEKHFAFGENWENFLSKITHEEIDHAANDLKRLMEPENLTQKSVLDIGCGSGIHALAAIKLGAGSVHGYDFDPLCVKISKTLLSRFAPEANFSIEEGDILKTKDHEEKTYDLVYSWGVLHHTGDLWKAIKNASEYVAPNGTFIIAIYLKTRFCSLWKKEKRFFAKASRPVQFLITVAFSALCILRLLARRKNPVKHIREYKATRGMNWWNDRRDWLGGWPYESAAPEEITDYLKKLGFRLDKSFNTTAPIGLLVNGCGEYVFKSSTGAESDPQ